MSSLSKILSAIVGEIFAGLGLPAELGAVRISDRPDLAQFQCNGAMAAGKKSGKPPREVAGAILAALEKNLIFAKVEIAGPGFINLNLTNEYISNALSEIAQNNRMGIEAHPAQNIILDYGGPNVAKPMHVGHLRSSIIGDSLRRIYKFAGFNALGDVHLGDWGLQMGQVISELEIRHPKWPYFDKAYTGSYPSASPVTIEDLEEIYPAASAACKNDEARAEIARIATLELHQGRKGYRALWKHLVDVSIPAMKKNFDALGVHFDLWKGESSVHDLIAPMVEGLKKKSIAVESDGALVINVALNSDKKEMPPLILYKRDGAVMYGTTDLATIVERVRDNKPAQIIYVVDQRQSLHFEQVFRAAKKGDLSHGAELIHAGFGTMNGPDGKPFKTRAGGVMKLEDLIATGLDKAAARLHENGLGIEAGDAEFKDIAHKVAIAAIKFADLHNNRTADYIFDIDRMISFEGKTGPYLLYQAVRIQSLLKKAGDFKKGAFVIKDEDRPLALLLAQLPDHFELALKNLAPHALCDYAHTLAQSFSAFYAACHILSETDEALRASRLSLCDLTFRQLKLLLELLGIEIPERM